MNSKTRGALDVVLYVIVFFLIQYVVTIGIVALSVWLGDNTWAQFSDQLAHGNFNLGSKALVGASVLSSLVTMAVFVKARWATLSRQWLATHPWSCLVWVVFLALGTILPSEWVHEQMELSMPEAAAKMFEAIMGEPVGYVAIGILAPLAEELVFRGAILGTLLKLFGTRLHWLAIAISALMFGAVHGNMPQFVHATAIGLILGWMYYRTGSIVPGIVFHWVNNTVAYVMFNLMPHMADGKLIDLFHGSERTMWMGIGFSLCLVVPSLYQLVLRLRRA